MPDKDKRQRGERPHPSWNPHTRQLHFRGRLVKRFKRSAPQQERILAAFEEESWPDTIFNPLSPVSGKTLGEVLHNVVEHLGQRQINALLQFSTVDGGKRVGWTIRRGAK